MKKNLYGISYGPPVILRDEPHRTLDTFSAQAESVEIEPCDFGSVSTFGEGQSFESIELKAEEVRSADVEELVR